MNTLAERIKAAMAGPPVVTQAELARACGVKAPSVADWMSGRTKSIEGENLVNAAAKLGVSAKWLATGRGQMRVEFSGSAKAPKALAGALGLDVPEVDTDASQPARLDRRKLAAAMETAEALLTMSDYDLPVLVRAEVIGILYDESVKPTPNPAIAITSAVNIIKRVRP